MTWTKLTPFNEPGIYEHHRFTVDAGQQPERIDKWLVQKTRYLTRSRIKKAAELGFLLVNGKQVKLSYKVKPFDEIVLALPYPPSTDLVPENLPLNIIYEDPHLLVINKPAGMVVHPGSGNYRGTLINALLYHLRKLPNKQEDPPLRPGLVHRIDKGTSGLLVIAKNEWAYDQLAKQFFLRQAERIYYCLVWGNIEEDRGTIVGHIGRSARDRKRYQVYEDGEHGKHAVTHFKVLARFGVLTLLQCKLETGRTHQIRVHFKYKNHPLFGDAFYGGHRILRGKPSNAYKRFMNDCLSLMPYQALHARTLGFKHPTQQKFYYFSSPLPDNFQILLRKLEAFFHVKIPPKYAVYDQRYRFSHQPILDFWAD